MIAAYRTILFFALLSFQLIGNKSFCQDTLFIIIGTDYETSGGRGRVISNAKVTINSTEGIWNSKYEMYEFHSVQPPFILSIQCEGYESYEGRYPDLRNYFGYPSLFQPINLVKKGETYFYSDWGRYPCKDYRDRLIVILNQYDQIKKTLLDYEIEFHKADSLIRSLGFITTLCPEEHDSCKSNRYIKWMKEVSCFYLMNPDKSDFTISPDSIARLLIGKCGIRYIGVPMYNFNPPETPWDLSDDVTVYFEGTMNPNEIQQLLTDFNFVLYPPSQKTVHEDFWEVHVTMKPEFLPEYNSKIEKLMNLKGVMGVVMESNGLLIRGG